MVSIGTPKPKFSKEICEIIKKGLETAPLEERKIVAEKTLAEMKQWGVYCCDNDTMSCAYFGMTSYI